MEIKTFSLNSNTETEITVSGGCHAKIKNLGDSPVFVSKNPHITPYGDGVKFIAPHSAELVKDTAAYDKTDSGCYEYIGSVYALSETDSEIEIETGNSTSDFFKSTNSIGGDKYILPQATETTLGGVKVDNTLNADSANPLQNKAVAERITAHERRERINITTIQGNENLSLLSLAVSEQNLEKYGMTIGDYFQGASGYTYTLADLNTFYGGKMNYAVREHMHIAIVVNTHALVPWKVNDIDEAIADTTGGYKESNLHKYLTETVLSTIESDIAALTGDNADSHLVKHSKSYSTEVAKTINVEINNTTTEVALMSRGNPAFQGAVRDSRWYASQYISALTESQVYGHDTYASSAKETGEAYKQLAVFRKYCPNLIFKNGNGNTSSYEWIWLRNVASSTSACTINDRGIAFYDATSATCVAAGLILFK